MASPHKKKIKKLLDSPSYRLAFKDIEFLGRQWLRPVRIQLELLKPAMILAEHRIRSTIVVYGSARTPDPISAKKQVVALEKQCRRNPRSRKLKEQLALAKRMQANSKYYREARKFGRIVSLDGQKKNGKSDGFKDYVIVTGGGPGAMEAANRGAADVHAETIGFNIQLPFEQEPNAYITPELCFQFHYFSIRKMHLLMLAKALVIFPGGFGTMDELFEVLTLVQTGKVPKLPIILFGKEYWTKVVNFQHFVDEGMISPEDIKLFRYADRAEEAWKMIQAFYKRYPKSKSVRDLWPTDFDNPSS